MSGHREKNADGVPVVGDAETITIIRANKGWAALNVHELWDYRDLLFQMATRDFRARYKQSFLGKVWVVIQPLLTMLVYYTIFGLVLQIKTGKISYPVFLLGGILIWQLFAGSASLISVSLTSNSHLLNKIYFPRLLLPFSSAMASCVDFFFAFMVLLVCMIFLGVYPGWHAIFCPAFVIMAVIAGLAFGLWMAPLNVTHRDVQQLVPLVLQILLYLSPVFYSPANVPEKWRILYYLNPMAAITQGFRWSLMNDLPPGWPGLVSMGVCIMMFIGGLYYFRKHESEFADRL